LEFRIQGPERGSTHIDEGQVIWSQRSLPLSHGGTSDYYNRVVFNTRRCP